MTDTDFDPFAGGELLRVAPTTAPQQEIITSSKMSDEANTAFNEGVSLTVTGILDVALLESCFDLLINRHEILRSTFSPMGDEICLQQESVFKLDFEDLRRLSDQEQLVIIDKLFVKIAITPMNLEEGPLISAWLKQLGDQQYEIIIAAHHVVCDGWSYGVLLNELTQLYRQGGNAEVLSPAPSFFDYSEQLEASKALNTDVDYWLNQFETLPPSLDLPLDGPRPSLRSFQADRYDYELPPVLVETLKKSAITLKSSLVNYVLAAYFALLYRLTGNEDIVVGLPVAGQAAMNQGDLVGHLVQLLPIRIQLNAETPFNELVTAVKNAVLDASEHPNFTFGQLLEHVTVDRSRVPLISTIFNIDQAAPTLDFGTASAELRSVPRSAESFELFFNLVPGNDKLLIEATYSSSLFSEQTMVAWLQSLESILEDAVSNDSLSLNELSLTHTVPAVLDNANQTATECQYPDFITAFKQQVAKQPDAVALIAGELELSYQQLSAQSSRLAIKLAGAGVGEGAVVAVCCQRSEYLLISTLAILNLGATYLPLDPDFPQQRLLDMLEDSGAEAIIEDATAPQRIKAAKSAHILIESMALATGPLSAEELSAIAPVHPAAGQAAYTIYTSGSTGKPKGVRIQHSAMVNFLDSMAGEPGFTNSDRLLAVTTLSFDISVLELFLPLYCGGTTIIASREDIKDGDRLAQLISQRSVSVMQATPSTWRMLLTSEWASSHASPLKALCGGEPLAADLVAELLPHVSELWNMFGPTETTVWSTCKRVQSAEGLITVGKPIANTQVYILDQQLKPQPLSVPGELWIGGKGVTLGYHQREALNAERFIEHKLFGRIYGTGDLAKVLPDGDIQHLGRLDDQVKLRGYRIELGDIETALVNCPEIERAAVYLWEINDQDVRIVACCISADNAELATIAIRRQLRDTLPSYMVPQYLLSIESIPLTPNGKVDRRALPRPELNESSILGQKILRNETEKLIANTWQTLLKSGGAIGRDDNFFEVGGHSLLALEAIRQIENATGVRLTPGDMVGNRLGLLAEKITQASTEETTASGPVALAQQASRQLNAEQIRLLQRQLAEPASTCNNLPAGWLLEGSMNIEAFNHSIERVVERQTALRSRVVSVENSYQWRLSPMSGLDYLQYFDYSDQPDGLEKALQQAKHQGLLPFDMVDASLCRIALYKISETQHFLTLTTHQLIFDGWSFDIFLGELESYYLAALEDRAARLALLPVQYRDYSHWSATEPVDEQALAFHSRTLDSASPESSLVNWDRNKGEYQRRTLHFDSDILATLETFCEQQKVRIHEVLLSLFAWSLADQEQRSELLVGLPVTGRYSPESIGLIGGFVSLLPLNLNVDKSGLTRAVQNIAEQLHEFYEHQTLSYAECQSRNEQQPLYPMIPVSFSFQDIRNRPLSLAGLTLSQIDMDRLQTEIPLEFWVRIQSDGLLMVFDNDTGQVDSAMLDALVNAINTLVTDLGENLISDGSSEAGKETEIEIPAQKPKEDKRPFWKRLLQ